MKIICVGRNYAAHASELNNPVPEEPVLFMKPDTAIPQARTPFYIPGFSEDVHHEVELVLKINKMGKNIDEKFASIREKRMKLAENPQEVLNILKEGTERTKKIAEQTMKEVREALKINYFG